VETIVTAVNVSVHSVRVLGESICKFLTGSSVAH